MDTGIDRGFGLHAANLALSLEALELHHRVCSGSLERKGRRLVLKSDGKGGRYLKFCRPSMIEAIQAAFGKGNASLATITTFCATHKIVSGALMNAVHRCVERHGERISDDSRTKLGQQLVAERRTLHALVEEMEKKEPLGREERSVLYSALDYLQSPSQNDISVTENDRCDFVAKCVGISSYLPIATALFRGMLPHERYAVMRRLVNDGKDTVAFALLAIAKTHLPIETVLTYAEQEKMGYYGVVRDILNEMVRDAGSDIKKTFGEFEKGHPNLVARLMRDKNANGAADS